MAVGYAGKLPAYGDFVAGGAAAAARRAWSAWAEAGLASAREGAERAAFADRFLTSALWRFAVAPGVFGERMAAGVMCPSMDKVGRLFPFVALAELDAAPPPAATLEALDGWLHATEEAVLGALEPDATLEAFEARLAAVAPPEAGGGCAPCSARAPRAVPQTLDAEGRLAAEGMDALDLEGPDEAAPDGLWITMGSGVEPPRGLAQEGPAGEALFDRLIAAPPAAPRMEPPVTVVPVTTPPRTVPPFGVDHA